MKITTEKRIIVQRIHQLTASDVKERNWVPVDGVCVLWRDLTVRANRSQFILTGKEEHVFDIQVLHQRWRDVNNFVDVIPFVGPKEEKQVRDTVCDQHDS